MLRNSFLAVSLVLLLCAPANADPSIKRAYDEFSGATMVYMEGNQVLLDSLDGSLGETLEFNYAGVVGDDGTIQGFVLMVVRVVATSDNIVPENREIKVRIDDDKADIYSCMNSRGNTGARIKDTCVSEDLDMDDIERFSNARVIRVGFGPLRGSTEPSAAVMFLEQFKE